MPGRTLLRGRRQTGDLGRGNTRTEEGLEAPLGLHALRVDPRQAEPAPQPHEIEENTDRCDGVDPVAEGHDVDEPGDVLGGDVRPTALKKLPRGGGERKTGAVERVLVAPQEVG